MKRISLIGVAAVAAAVAVGVSLAVLAGGQFNTTQPDRVEAAPEAVLADTDGDGCTAAQEAGPDENFGGRRDDTNFWDFFDTPDSSNSRDKFVNIADIFRLVQRFGTVGDETIDPLSAPASAFSYHTAFDRTLIGPNPWNLGPPDGFIVAGDINSLKAQFGHSCLVP